MEIQYHDIYDISWYIMIYGDISFVIYHDISFVVIYHDILWYIMIYCDILWYIRHVIYCDIYDISWYCDILWYIKYVIYCDIYDISYMIYRDISHQSYGEISVSNYVNCKNVHLTYNSMMKILSVGMMNVYCNMIVPIKYFKIKWLL